MYSYGRGWSLNGEVCCVVEDMHSLDEDGAGGLLGGDVERVGVDGHTFWVSLLVNCESFAGFRCRYIIDLPNI